MSNRSRHSRTTTGTGLQVAVVTLPAEIDVRNDGQVGDALAGALRSGAAVLVADASGTRFCGCAGVTALIRAHHEAAAAGAQLRVAASPAVRRILELTQADGLLSTYPTVPAALADGQRPAGSNGGPPTGSNGGLMARVTRVRHRLPHDRRAAR
jgi:anti-anti-sigma factor